jgi:hypothetical protein
MNRRVITRTLGIAVLISIGFTVFRLITHSKSMQTVLPSQNHVLDEAQFLFKPVFEQQGNNSYLKLMVKITSYIEPGLLDFDFEEITVIDTGDSFIYPKSFTIIEKSTNELVGMLLFESPYLKPSTPFRLKLFLYSDHDIAFP